MPQTVVTKAIPERAKVSEEILRLVDDYTWDSNLVNQIQIPRKPPTESKEAIFAKLAAHKDKAIAAVRERAYGMPNGSSTLKNLLTLGDKLDPASTHETLAHLLTMRNRLQPSSAAKFAAERGNLPELLDPMLNAAASLAIPTDWDVLACIPKATGDAGFARLKALLVERKNAWAPNAISLYGEKAIEPLEMAIHVRKDLFRLKCLDALSAIKSPKPAALVLADVQSDLNIDVAEIPAGLPDTELAHPPAPGKDFVAPKAESAYLAHAFAHAGPTALPQIRRLVKDRHLYMSRAGVWALILMHDAAAFDDLIAVPQADRLFGEAIPEAMRIAPDKGIATIEKLLTDRNPHKRQLAQNLFFSYPGADRNAAPKERLYRIVLSATKSRHADIRADAYQWFAFLRPEPSRHAEETAAALYAGLWDRDVHVRCMAVSSCIGEKDANVVARIKALAIDAKQPEEVREAAKRVLEVEARMASSSR